MRHDIQCTTMHSSFVTSSVCLQLQGLRFESEFGLLVCAEFYMFSPSLCGFPHTSQKHACRWIGYAKLVL